MSTFFLSSSFLSRVSAGKQLLPKRSAMIGNISIWKTVPTLILFLMTLIFSCEYPERIIINEAPELPVLFKHLRGVIDQARDHKNRCILTGSSSLELSLLAGDTLTGRIGIVEFGTFEMNEIHGEPLSSFYRIFEHELSKESIDFLKGLAVSRGSNCDSLDIFLNGGYPEPILAENKGSMLRYCFSSQLTVQHALR